MAKRHPGLISLSHDHHHGLAMAVRLKRGDRALLTDGWTHDRKEQVRLLLEFFEQDLVPHFAAEERVLFSVLRDRARKATQLADELTQQHRRMESMIAALRDPRAGHPDAVLVDFGKLLENHIRSEERELFPLCESELSATLLQEIGVGIARVRSEVLAAQQGTVHVSCSRVINTPNGRPPVHSNTRSKGRRHNGNGRGEEDPPDRG